MIEDGFLLDVERVGVETVLEGVGAEGSEGDA
jgi:hypothetical protein